MEPAISALDGGVAAALDAAREEAQCVSTSFGSLSPPAAFKAFLWQGPMVSEGKFPRESFLPNLHKFRTSIFV